MSLLGANLTRLIISGTPGHCAAEGVDLNLVAGKLYLSHHQKGNVI
jgi:hypothetical protein